jgi:hypothetical protein
MKMKSALSLADDGDREASTIEFSTWCSSIGAKAYAYVGTTQACLAGNAAIDGTSMVAFHPSRDRFPFPSVSD